MKNFIYIFSVMFLGICLQNNKISAQSIPLNGEIVITEFMPNPAAVSDTKGEWVEIQNSSDRPLLLNGISISDLGSNSHTITSENDIILEPGAFYILARNEDPEVNGGINPDYIYSNFSLGNSEDEIILISSEDITIDQVAYTSDWILSAGSSLELNIEKNDASSNDLPEHWHPGTESYGDGDLGTPGALNSISSGINKKEIITQFEAFPNPCSSELNIRLSAFSPSPVKIELINLLGQTIPILEEEEVNDDLNFSVDLSPYPVGIYWLGVSINDQRECLKVIKLKLP